MNKADAIRFILALDKVAADVVVSTTDLDRIAAIVKSIGDTQELVRRAYIEENF